MKNIFEVIIYGRGGQGAKTTAELIAQAGLAEGKSIQAFPEYGPERSGAPVRTYARLSQEKIRTREPIIDPDCVLVLDDSLPKILEIDHNIDNKEPIIVNTSLSRHEYLDQVKLKGKVICVDASAISRQIIGENRPNTAILGKFAFVTEQVKIDSLTKAFQEKYLEKLGKEKTEKNIRAVEEAYNV